jgi:hypothetical protein
VKRDSSPYYRMVVLNRLNIKDMVQTIDGQFEVQHSDPFLIFQNAKEEIHGIWFYNPEERERIGGLVDRFVRTTSSSSFSSSFLLSLLFIFRFTQGLLSFLTFLALHQFD